MALMALEPTRIMIQDMQAMLKHECGQKVSLDEAAVAARKALRGQKEREAMYRVSMQRLCKSLLSGFRR